ADDDGRENGRRTVLDMVYFFFQAEDGIRDYKVTGVQTCALPISKSKLAVAITRPSGTPGSTYAPSESLVVAALNVPETMSTCARSEERRVGKEWRSRLSADR